MTKVFIGEPLPGVKTFPILNKQLGKEPYTGTKPFRAIFDEMDFSFIELVGEPRDADYFLIPHYYSSVRGNTPYIDFFVSHARKYGKKILIFAYGDSEEDIAVPESIIFRYAGYKYMHREGDGTVIMPTQIYAGDILEENLFFLRDKSDIPTVSFCGWGELGSFRQKLKYLSRIVPLDFRKYVLRDVHADVHKQGIYWRKKAMHAVEGSPRVKTSFLVRDFYSASKKTMKGDPVELRREYIANILQSDFVLMPRGDANMATRFYETLALGRIPVVIDTEWVLPLQNVVDYRKFVVFVPYTDVRNTDIYIRKFWDGLTNETFHAAQKQARETFMKYLRFDSFLKYMFENNLKL